jgi:hypothetical protein
MEYDWGGHGVIKFQSQKNKNKNSEKKNIECQNCDQILITIFDGQDFLYIFYN